MLPILSSEKPSSSSLDSRPRCSARDSAVHFASLIDPAAHPSALLQLVEIKLSSSLIGYLVDRVFNIVEYVTGHIYNSSPSARSAYHTKFTAFVSRIIHCADVAPPTILTALVYIDRARPHLQISVEEWALERVFLGALIIASKYTNDSTLKNTHWALCTGLFGKRDVGRIEREFLEVLGFKLGVSENDILVYHGELFSTAEAYMALVPQLQVAVE